MAQKILRTLTFGHEYLEKIFIRKLASLGVSGSIEPKDVLEGL